MFKKEQAEAVNYIKGLINNTYDKGVYLSKFLTQSEQDILEKMVGNNFNVYCEGGYEGASLKRVLLSNFEITNPNLKVVSLKLTAENNFYTLKHPTVKWYFLNSGIDERMFGDIISVDNYFIINVCEEIVKMLLEETHTINKCRVNIEIVDEEISENEKELHIAFASGLRLDGVCARCFHLSRSNAQKFIDNDRVKVNGQIITKLSYEVHENDVITVIGVGKIIVKNIELNTKTKRYRIYHNRFLRK